MKQLLSTLLIAAAFALSGCESETPLGPCYGLGDQDAKRPDLVYRVSETNVIVGIVFFELVWPPVIVALHELWCPVERKTPTP